MSKKHFLVFVIALAGAALITAAAHANLDPGAKAPDFTLPTLSGTSFTLSNSFKSPTKVVVLNLWATPSVPCKAEVPYLVDLDKNYGGKGAMIVGVSLDVSKSKVKEFVKTKGVDYVVPLDPKASKLRDSYKLRSVPVTYVIDKKGMIQYVHSGFPSNPDEQKKESATIESEIKKLLSE